MKINGIAIVFTFVALSFVCNGFVSAAEIVIHPTPTINPLQIHSDKSLSQEPDNGIEIENISGILSYWNARLQWGFSQEQIIQNSSGAEETLLKNYPTSDGKWFHIKNLTKFDEELGRYVGLNNDQISRFILEDRKQLVVDRQNYHKPYSQSNNVLAGSDISKTDYVLTSVLPGSQSAPYAIGTLYYLYILTDFTSPSSDGTWEDNQAHISDALFDAGEGTWQIMDQAPINVWDDGSWAWVTVNGENLGDHVTTWGQNGWMEQAALQFGHGMDSDGRYTTKLAKYMKSISGADSVILVFFTHDDKGATAIGPDQGYSDKVLVSYWGKSSVPPVRFDSVPGSYEHEIVHAYGALDEYIGGNGVDCNYGPSGLAVSPMYEMYKNTNYHTCPSSTKRGIMENFYYDPFWYEISPSSRKFIGWGDFDGDGMVDPLDSDPYHPPLPVAGFAASGRVGTAPLVDEFYDQSYNANAWAWDFENDGTVDSTEQNPVHTYTAGGTYTVKLTATNPWGSDDEIKVGYIVVNGLAVRPLPGYANPPTDPDSDGLYEDLNGNGVKDTNDVVLFFKNRNWMSVNEPVASFDFNHNMALDTNDVVLLFKKRIP